MSSSIGPRINTSGVIGVFDIADSTSYPGTGVTWNNLVGDTSIALSGVTYTSGGLFLDEDEAYMSLPGDIHSGSGITITGWAKFTGNSFPATGTLVARDTSGGDPSLELVLASGGSLLSEAQSLMGYRTINSGTWFHFAQSSNWAGTSLYLNGGLRAVNGSGLVSSSETIYIGKSADHDLNRFFQGGFKVLQVYDRALNDLEIEANYIAQRGRFGDLGTLGITDVASSGGGNVYAGPYAFTPNYVYTSSSSWSADEDYTSGDDVYDTFGIEKIEFNNSFCPTVHFKDQTSVDSWRAGENNYILISAPAVIEPWEGLYSLNQADEYTFNDTYDYVSYDSANSTARKAIAEYAAEAGVGVSVINLTLGTSNPTNEAPVGLVISPTGTTTIAASGDLVGYFRTSDAIGGAMTYSLVSGTGDTDNANFSITGSGLYVQESPLTAGDESVRVRTTDSGGLYYEKALIINITQKTLVEILNEDWESGLNGWTIVDDAASVNQWEVGTATQNGGTQSAYVSNDGGTTNAYTDNDTAVSHIYTGFTTPSDISGGVTLDFDWKCEGESSYDYLKVYITPSGTTPTGGTQVSSSYNVKGVGQYYNQQNSWQSVTDLDVDTWVTAADTYYNIIFQWRNDGSVGYNPPAAVDNVVIKTIN